MARKVFLSILGTSFYKECTYTKGTFRSTPTRYIQEATLDLLQTDKWDSENDKILIFYTDLSQKLNWNANITTRLDYTKTEQAYIGLEKILNDKAISTMTKGILIPDGKNEEEQWTIFTTIFNQLEEGDELYLDITHGFRPLPMLLLVLCNYAKFLKHTTIRSITYGNYEAGNKIEAPITDLYPIALLQDWTFAAADFIRNGRTENLQGLCKQAVGNIYRHTSNQNTQKKGEHIRDYMNRVNKLIEHLQLCQATYLLDNEAIGRLHENESLIPKDVLQPFQPILHQITESIEVFQPENSSRNFWEATVWCYNKNMYQQAITFLQEGIISLICEKNEWNVQNISSREIISQFLNLLRHGQEHNYARWMEKTNDERIMKLDSHKAFYASFSTPYSDLSRLRNSINHAAMHDRQQTGTVNTMKKNIGNHIQKFKSLFFAQ